MTQGDVASLDGVGLLSDARAGAACLRRSGMSYTLQRYDGSNPAALAAVADGNRFAGLVYAFDAWTITQKVSLLYGGRYAKYGYIEHSLFSPRARLTIAPTAIPASQLRRVAARGGAGRRGVRAVDDRGHLAAARAHVRADLGRDLHAASGPRTSTRAPSTTSRRPTLVGVARVPAAHGRSARHAVRPRQRRAAGRGPRSLLRRLGGDVVRARLVGQHPSGDRATRARVGRLHRDDRAMAGVPAERHCCRCVCPASSRDGPRTRSRT